MFGTGLKTLPVINTLLLRSFLCKALVILLLLFSYRFLLMLQLAALLLSTLLLDLNVLPSKVFQCL
ncbi:hypothetical protein PsorP6_013329 [Peronosclerospora sorghi]|uniref:Uncharacterized protein n=1 Tax=Peronosclerospora sorghi TaxID=230839 RepID=A0ACC0WHC4_9STRA|nr:hypothetical protein PsorP6_013329 [Peronosclerospora sorghi]